MKKVFVLLSLACALFSTTLRAEDKPSNVPASREAENRILKAEHAHDQVAKQQGDVNLQMQQLQVQAQQRWDALDKQAKELAIKEQATSKELDAVIEQVWKESGLNKTTYDFDAADFTFKPKIAAKPAQAKK
jgi:hypothetical protein